MPRDQHYDRDAITERKRQLDAQRGKCHGYIIDMATPTVRFRDRPRPSIYGERKFRLQGENIQNAHPPR